MRITTLTLKKAEKLERELFLSTEKLASILQKPASQRDAGHLTHTWLETSRSRGKMGAMGRLFQKIKKPKRAEMTGRDYREHSEIYKQTREFIKRLRAWDEMECIVQRHLEPVRQPLLPRLKVNGHDDLLTQLYTALHRLANPAAQGSSARNLGCFPDIPMPIRTFDLLMSAAYRVGLAQNPRRTLRFLDVGCGGGTKVLAATRYFWQADGLEYDQGYVDSARRSLQIIGASNSTIFQADAMTFDSYAEYDVIYFFRPLRNDALLEAMEQYIIQQARPGTILLAPYNGSLAGRAGMDCARVEGPVFVTGIEQVEADQLRRDAEATGTDILNRSPERGFDTGYWAPILDAASFNGIA